MTSGQAISKLKHDKKYSNEVIEPLEKEHKALEIIKEKRIDVALLMSCSCYKQYCDIYIRRWFNVKNIPLPTQEEFDLVIEVLL